MPLYLCGWDSVIVPVMAAARGAVLVIEEYEADGNCADAEEQEGRKAQRDGGCELVYPRHAVGAGDLEVDTGTVGKHHASGEVAGLGR